MDLSPRIFSKWPDGPPAPDVGALRTAPEQERTNRRHRLGDNTTLHRIGVRRCPSAVREAAANVFMRSPGARIAPSSVRLLNTVRGRINRGAGLLLTGDVGRNKRRGLE